MGRTVTVLNIIPLLVLPLILYNFVVLTGLAGAEPDAAGRFVRRHDTGI
jgi:hypothetical protein